TAGNAEERCNKSELARSELVHSDGIVPRLPPPVRPLIRMSDGKERFHTPRLASGCMAEQLRSNDQAAEQEPPAASGSRACPGVWISFILLPFYSVSNWSNK
ncbi:MAG: hypothetical protein DRP70_08970, partial [Spirochaetes bacterium]